MYHFGCLSVVVCSKYDPRVKKREHDFAVTAFRVVKEATKESEEPQVASDQPELLPESKNPHTVALGRLGGKKGGKARAAQLASEQWRDIGRKAALKRWSAER